MTKIAILGGGRTPFTKAAGALTSYDSLALGLHVVNGLVDKLKLDAKQIDELIFSSVLLNPNYPNLAREIVLRSKLPKSISAHFISNNCISGLVAINFLAEAIKSNRINLGLAGGAESMSNPTLTFNSKAQKFFLKLARTKNYSDRLKLALSFRPNFIFPKAPSPKEPSTGLTMGEHCEITAKEFAIAQLIQDEIAFKSHLNASSAQSQGFLNEEILNLEGLRDNLIRPDTNLEKLSKLKPVFDRSSAGTITAGNSSALTDGASVVCLASEHRARELGHKILGFIDDIQFAAIDPKQGLLMAPCVALPKLLAKNNLKISDIDYFEIHEAFGAQVAANLQVWEQSSSKYPEFKIIGKIPTEKINVNGGSIAIGHPFAATGGRLIISAINQLNRSGKQKAAISVCAAGAMAAAVLVSRN